MARTQQHRTVAVGSPLGEDVLMLHAMYGEERLGQPFTYQLDLLSEQRDIAFANIVGENITVRLELNEGSTRYFNGYVSRFTQLLERGGMSCYRAEVVPWLWFLTRSIDCRIFQHMTAPEIIKQVCRDHGFDRFDDRLTGSYRSREYCVQYRESAFNFISRLMEQEGIYYFFAHANGSHQLVLCDAPGNHSPFAGCETLSYRPPNDNPAAYPAFWNWSMEQGVHATSYALNDYNFEQPRTPLEARRAASFDQSVTGLEVYDYPGEYTEMADGERYAQLRMEALEARHAVHRAESNAMGVCTGHTVTLEEHPRSDMDGELLITSVVCQIASDDYGAGGDEGGGEVFSCRFTGIDANKPFRMPTRTPKPAVEGPQTAVVRGGRNDSEGDIATDMYGRVKVKFHWDRYNESASDCSCWIRVAQLWAGNQWGAMYIPRVGQEVIVDFLEGDPDRPIITGRVYNAAQKPPYNLPEEMTKSTIKSKSVGGEGFNEIRFDDKAGEEHMFFHAQRDHHLRVINDSFECVENDAHQIVQNNRHEQVDGDAHLIVKGDENTQVNGSVSQDIKQDLQQKVGMKHGLDANEIHLKAGMNVVIEAGMSITLKAGGGFVVIGPAGVAVSGTPIMLNSGGSAGSGSGCSPATAEAPTEALTADSGRVSDPPRRPAPPKPSEYSSSARVLQMSAASGAPFCEQCAEAAQSGQ